MNNIEKAAQLRSLIYGSLISYIDSDFVFLDTPHHFNSGDTLIFEGTLKFISNLDHSCVATAGAYSYDSQLAIKRCNKYKHTTILLHGGGNFGDLWPLHQQYRNELIKRCPDNKIIILPQTIYYQDKSNLERDAMLYGKRTNITLCVRDTVSLATAQRYFPDNNPILVPDMAFCIEPEANVIPEPQCDNLMVMREDKELSLAAEYDIVPSDAFISDWPTLNSDHPVQLFNPSTLQWASRIDRILHSHLRPRLDNYYWNTHRRRLIVDSAFSFIGNYKNIYTTRMHAAILSVLLNRDKTVLFDNSYGKSSSFADTWFGDLDNFELIR